MGRIINYKIPLFVFLIMLPDYVKGQQMPASDKFHTTRGDVKLTLIGHGSLMFELEDFVIHVDPSRMAADYKVLEKTIAGGGFPDESILEAFINHSNEMARFADPEWQEAMIEYQDHLENLKRAVENKQLEVVHHEIRDLRARMKACHRDFK